VGATLYLDRLPCSTAVRTYVAETATGSVPVAAGDDYELCVTVPDARQGEIEALAAELPARLHWVGMIGVRQRFPGAARRVDARRAPARLRLSPAMA